MSNTQPPTPPAGATDLNETQSARRATTEKPAAIALAQKLMYTGAAIAVLSVIASFLTLGQLRDQIRDSAPNMTPDEVDAAASATLIFGTALTLIYVGLWLWMAWANGRGKKWARITGTVFFGLSTFGLLYFLAFGLGVAKIMEAISYLVGAATVYLLWAGKGSKEYFETMSHR